MDHAGNRIKIGHLRQKQPTNKIKIRILSETSILYLICHASFILTESNALPTEPRWICGEGFKLLLYSTIYSNNVTPHCRTAR